MFEKRPGQYDFYKSIGMQIDTDCDTGARILNIFCFMVIA
jgi:hypothetical protein